MEVFLLKAVVFARIISSFEYAAVAFDLAAIALFVIIVGLFFANMAVRKDVSFSAIDAAIVAFAVWCVAVSLIYFEDTRLRDVAKLLTPLLSYVVVKNVLKSDSDYGGVLFWAVAGFAIAIVGSAILIMRGQGVDYVTYWTGIPRWQGVYTGAHTFGHSMVLFIMIAVIYLHIKKLSNGFRSAVAERTEKIVLVALVGLALFCLYASQVRTAMLGLVVFSVVCLYFLSKRKLVVFALALIGLAAASTPYWLPALFPDVVTLQQGRSDESNLASGRLTYWRHNLDIFADLSIDRKLAGVGIGNRAETMYVGKEEVLDSHNDWLDILMQTGIVGFMIFVVLQFFLLRAIFRLPAPTRVFFLAMFLAASVMMFVSDSYVWRVQVGHLYYIALAYVEAKRSSETTPEATLSFQSRLSTG